MSDERPLEHIGKLAEQFRDPEIARLEARLNETLRVVYLAGREMGEMGLLAARLYAIIDWQQGQLDRFRRVCVRCGISEAAAYHETEPGHYDAAICFDSFGHQWQKKP